MAATPDSSLGFFSAVCSSIRAASSAWRRIPGDDEDEATVRSRLARRAGAKRRLGRTLAFASFNLEVLLFVYAFWRARRRRNFNWSWRHPVLLIPALAAIIYAAFVRLITTLDLKDKKTLRRLQLQQQNDSLQTQNHLNGVKKCDPSPSQSDRPSTNLRDDDDDDGGGMSWGQQMQSDGVRRRMSSRTTNSSAFRQPIDWSSEHLSGDPEGPNCMQSTAKHHSNPGPDVVADNGISRMSRQKSNGGVAEEDAVQIALVRPESDHLPAIAELHHEGVENESSKFHGTEDNRMPFISEEFLMGSYAVQNTERHLGTSGYTLCSQETEIENVAGGACFVKVSPELSFISSRGLVADGGNDDSGKESCASNIDEESDIVVNSEEEAFLRMPAVNTAEQCSGTSGFSLCAQDSSMMEFPPIINISSVIPESDYPPSVELVAEDNEQFKVDEAYSRNSNPYSLYDNLVENEEPYGCQGGGTESKDEMNFAFLDTPILINEATVLESCTDSAGCSQCIPESNIIQSLHNGKRDLPETFSIEESPISPDQERNLEIFSLYSRSSSCVSEVGMIETLRVGTFSAPQNGSGFNFDDTRINSLGYQHISDGTATLQGAERLSSEIFHDDIFCKSGSSISLDSGNEPDNSSANSDSVMHTVQKNALVLLDFQGSGTIEGVNMSRCQSHDEHPRSYVPADKANHPEYLRSSSSMADNNLMELLAAGLERSFDPKDKYLSSFEETSLSENPPNNLISASHNSKTESVTSSGKGLPDPTLEGVDSFDKIPGDEQENKSLEENSLSCEQIAITRAEVNCTESQGFADATKPDCCKASESFNVMVFEPEHQEGPELVLSQVEMPFLIDEGEETEKALGSCSIACASSHHGISILEPLQVLPVSAGSEKGFLEGSKVFEQCCTDKEPKDLEVKDMKEDVEDLDEDHEVSRTPSDVALNFYLLY